MDPEKLKDSKPSNGLEADTASQIKVEKRESTDSKPTNESKAAEKGGEKVEDKTEEKAEVETVSQIKAEKQESTDSKPTSESKAEAGAEEKPNEAGNKTEPETASQLDLKKQESIDLKPTNESKVEAEEVSQLKVEKQESIDSKPTNPSNVETGEASQSKVEKQESIDLKPTKTSKVEAEAASQSKVEKQESIDSKPTKTSKVEAEAASQSKVEKQESIDSKPTYASKVEAEAEPGTASQLKMGKQESMDSKPSNGSEADTDTISFQSIPKSLTISESSGSFEVPSTGPMANSGFDYHQKLFDLQVPPAEWSKFNDELVYALRLTTSEKVASWSIGVSVGIIAAIPLTIFGAGPGYYAWRAADSKYTESKIKESMQEVGELVTVLNNWNNNVFKEKGFSVKLALPRKQTQGSKRDSMYKLRNPLKRTSSSNDEGLSKAEKEEKNKESKKLDKRFRLIIDIIDKEKVKGKDKAGTQPSNFVELEGDENLGAAPSYSAANPPPYKGGAPPQELDGDARGGGAVVEADNNPIYELA